MSKVTITITIRKIDNKLITDVNGKFSALDAMIAAVRLLVISEKLLPKDMRANFRADFLEALNRERREELEEIENR